MSKGNFVDNLKVEDLNKFYVETGFCTVIEDGHAVSSLNENRVNEVVAKGYMALDEYGKERFRNTTCIDINDLYKEIKN